MKRGITVLVSLIALVVVGYFTASKWAIRHEVIAFHDASRDNRLVAVNVAVRRDKEMQANAGLIKLPVAILNHGNTVKNSEYSFLSTVFAWRGYLAVSPQHDLPTDPPMVTKVGEPYVGRLPQIQRGVANIHFAIHEMQKVQPNADYEKVTMVGHSMGGMVCLIYAGTFPQQVSALVVLDGVTVLPNAKSAPAHERIAKWAGQLDTLETREPRRYRTIEEAAAQMRARNTRLPPELAQHLAAFGVRRNNDDTYSWKFDPYQRAMAPHRLSPEDHVSLWSRITCPTLLLHAAESFLEGRENLAGYFQNARSKTISGAGHWLHHERPDEVLRAIRTFLGLTDNDH